MLVRMLWENVSHEEARAKEKTGSKLGKDATKGKLEVTGEAILRLDDRYVLGPRRLRVVSKRDTGKLFGLHLQAPRSSKFTSHKRSRLSIRWCSSSNSWCTRSTGVCCNT